ncbi:hypothetical protein [Staphylococcus aureus]|uniref:hypothetical protein n=1 Tax=Staphylococcus aureus TaxID=1280 RepID=UPI000B13BCC7|nr:hypothetical protein [Staphylococcus aureus]
MYSLQIHIKDGIKALLDHEQFNVDIQTGLSEEALIKIIPSYHALIVRSQTTVTENIIMLLIL